MEPSAAVVLHHGQDAFKARRTFTTGGDGVEYFVMNESVDEHTGGKV